MKKLLFVCMMTLPFLGWSQKNYETIDFTKKLDPTTHCLRMSDINRMFANAELIWCEIYQIDPDQKGKIAVWKTVKGETLMLVSEEYTSRRYCITTYFEVDDGSKGIWIGFESRNQYPKLFKKLDRKLRGAYVKEVNIKNPLGGAFFIEKYIGYLMDLPLIEIFILDLSLETVVYRGGLIMISNEDISG